ncbi:hypothetical protein P168DRAFT_12732 [Aspergillus campestris IBT 28561]|uniref:Uncharacterized protein n=1 Tax=Aspergillus campestris (strain IBT 28561) TaxID=1392248 RepID=A0A2I1DEF2_ASPC2|nr:uncharacterized protein P168DRAFT_12732 [Aspergillus campestris IBT 28561]PKY08265.1 hypothetical protein P168DRAFT_12732 [Aspergillus campestris IBT 28561]
MHRLHERTSCPVDPHAQHCFTLDWWTVEKRLIMGISWVSYPTWFEFHVSGQALYSTNTSITISIYNVTDSLPYSLSHCQSINNDSYTSTELHPSQEGHDSAGRHPLVHCHCLLTSSVFPTLLRPQGWFPPRQTLSGRPAARTVTPQTHLAPLGNENSALQL